MSNGLQISLHGRVSAHANGNVVDDGLRLTASSSICNDTGRVSLTAKPRTSPSLSVDKRGVVSTLSVETLPDMVNTDYDLRVSKSTQVAGIDADLDVVWENVPHRAPNVNLNLRPENGTEVRITVAKAGSTKVNSDESAIDSDMVRVGAKLPVNNLIGRDDISADVDFDLRTQRASARIGYTAGDLNAHLRSKYNVNNGQMSHRIGVSWSGLGDGVVLGADVNDRLEGNIEAQKDRYRLRVPVDRNGPNLNNARLQCTWDSSI